MEKRQVRVYTDTSVFGGVFDERFEAPSREFFEEVRGGRFLVVTSALVQEELAPAPARVRDFFAEMLEFSEIVEISSEALRLREAYLNAGVLTDKWSSDALHVATASVSGCSMIVSWNFHHIVHFERIPKYNAVNTLCGHPTIAIHSPLEVLDYDDRDA